LTEAERVELVRLGKEVAEMEMEMEMDRAFLKGVAPFRLGSIGHERKAIELMRAERAI
jgi:hypothetical protein